MERREMIKVFSGAIAASGLNSAVSAEDANHPPLYIKVDVPLGLPESEIDAVRDALEPLAESVSERLGVKVPLVVTNSDFPIELVRE